MIFGCHVSIAGGVEKVPLRAQALGAECFQIFTQNQRQWKSVTYSAQQAAAFTEARRQGGYSHVPLVSHASYLINLCAQEEEKLQRSRRALTEELARCDSLGIEYLVIHPGSHGGLGEDWGVAAVADTLNGVLQQEYRVKILLETTAGQGANLGYRLEHLRDIINRTRPADRLAVCVDTCHVFAAGYDIATEQGWQSFMRSAAEVIGQEKLLAWHLNDSVHAAGSRKDRHAAIGEGYIGLQGFKRIISDERLQKTPGILEIPGGDEKFSQNLVLLKQMRESGDCY